MKKLLSAIAVVLCGAFLCIPVSAASDPYKVYSAAIEKFHAASSVEMKVTTGAEVDNFMDAFKTVATIKRVKTSGDKVEMAISAVTDGETLKSYYKNGYFYEETSSGTKVKTKIGPDAALLNSYSLNFAISKAMMKDATIEPVEGGQKILFTIASADMMKLLGDYFESDSTGMKMKISDVGNSITVDSSGNLKSMKQWFNITFSDGSISMKMKYSSVANITSVNKLSSISFPDLSDYQ